mmetsp:Transcript_139145/g.388192  ORF Transcript_139145/g.388192 Transcript_139145/m.388192 type:complete len:339 (-) Transcript_139145:156-1172(-)|eukprot:CAMPEP_0179142120 /NCGR_PEP_ID=MMETSP0796-20121207/68229_1 /TAXON_ID=73915 /ORGANISM="Pyrodinium bahamense, Strain pbaha01" /LENGTH=338 /DNA_ID=CAMNT_0020841947 /DNA_START=66 /DNA_END=1082 /DNA_ORIENTATION=+
MAFQGSNPSVLRPKACIEDSECESCAPTARALGVTDHDGCRLASCRRPRAALLFAVLCLLGVEFATIRVTQWRSLRKELRGLERQNEALHSNLTAMRLIERNNEEQRALVESEMRLREAHCGDVGRELHFLQEENAMLRGNVSRLVAEQAINEEELKLRQQQFEAMQQQMAKLEENNAHLRGNLSVMEEQRKMLQHDLDMHYSQFLDMRAAMLALEQQNTGLVHNLTDMRVEAASLERFEAAQSNQTTELLLQNSLLRTNLTRLQKVERKERVEDSFASEELDKRYKQYMQMRDTMEELRRQNAQLRSDLFDLAPQLEPLVEHTTTMPSASAASVVKE